MNNNRSKNRRRGQKWTPMKLKRCSLTNLVKNQLKKRNNNHSIKSKNWLFRKKYRRLNNRERKIGNCRKNNRLAELKRWPCSNWNKNNPRKRKWHKSHLQIKARPSSSPNLLQALLKRNRLLSNQIKSSNKNNHKILFRQLFRRTNKRHLHPQLKMPQIQYQFHPLLLWSQNQKYRLLLKSQNQFKMWKWLMKQLKVNLILPALKSKWFTCRNSMHRLLKLKYWKQSQSWLLRLQQFLKLQLQQLQ